MDNVHIKAKPLPDHEVVLPPDGVDRPHAYLLRAQNEASPIGLVTPRLVEFLEQRDRLSVETAGEWVAVYRMNRVTPPAQLGEFVLDAVEVVSLLRHDEGQP